MGNPRRAADAACVWLSPADPLIGAPVRSRSIRPRDSSRSGTCIARASPRPGDSPGCQRRRRGHRLGFPDNASGIQPARSSGPTTPLTAERGHQAAHAAHGTAVLGIAGRAPTRPESPVTRPKPRCGRSRGTARPAPSRCSTEPWAEAIDFVRRTDAGAAQGHHPRSADLARWRQLRADSRRCTAPFARPSPTAASSALPPATATAPPTGTIADEPFDPTGSILVGATAYHETQNKRASFSNYGSRVVVSAPGDPQHDLTCGQAAD